MTQDRESEEFRKKFKGVMAKALDGIAYERHLYLSAMIGNLIRGVNYTVAMPDTVRNRKESDCLVGIYQMICSELGIEADNPPSIVLIPFDRQPIDPREFRIYTQKYNTEICDQRGVVEDGIALQGFPKRYRKMDSEETSARRRVFENWIKKYGK